ELDALNAKPGEEDSLDQARRRLMNREKLAEALRLASDAISGGAEEGVFAAQRALAKVAADAPELEPVIAALDRAAAELQEATHGLNAVELDDGEHGSLDRIEERLFALRALARKH